jgi:uncharacterized protein (DUF488 family)
METFTEPRKIVGVGYEGQGIDEFIDKLAVTGTRILVDIRLNPVSRKRGFSKRLLAAALAEAGIDYRHMPELGNPKWNRAGFSGSRAEVLAARERFSRMLDNEIGARRLDEIANAAAGGVVAVMCFEADEHACHRYVVLAELRRRLEQCRVPA